MRFRDEAMPLRHQCGGLGRCGMQGICGFCQLPAQSNGARVSSCAPHGQVRRLLGGGGGLKFLTVLSEDVCADAPDGIVQSVETFGDAPYDLVTRLAGGVLQAQRDTEDAVNG
jgi:hypothetical protein